MKLLLCKRVLGIPIFLLSFFVTSQLYAQDIVKGTVASSEGGELLPGVSVLVKGTTVGSVTDLNGNYSVKATQGDVLQFSYIGFETQEIEVGSATTLDIQLVPDLEELEEVIVVGYGTVKKTDITGSVSSIDSKDIAKIGSTSAVQAVQGKLAGVNISQSSGRAGAGFSIQIRGQNSLSAKDPLYVVDGVVTDGIDFLNPQDIERIDVLKDASSTAIYGSRGTNGVVIVTTKGGTGVKEGKATISYDGYYGVRQIARMPDFMNGDEWWEFRQNAYITGMLQSGSTDYDETIGGVANSDLLAQRVANREYTDWIDLVTRTGTQQNHFLSVSGNNGRMSYVIGAGYQEEKGNLAKEEYRRYNFKGNVNHKISDKWTAGMNINLSLSERELGSNTAITNAFRMSPLVSPYDSTGALLIQPAKYAGISFTSSVNPLVDIEDGSDNTRNIYGVGNLYLQFSPLKGIDLKSTFSPSFKSKRRGRYWGSMTDKRKFQDPAANLQNDLDLQYTWDNQITATKNLNDHSLTVMGVQSFYYTQYEGNEIDVTDLPFNSSYYNLGTAANLQSVASSFSKTTLMSYAFRVNYGWKDKYLITLSNRWDGSSVLSEGYKWASFPSAAVAWRISEEPFLAASNVISELKLRLSYGFTGNNNVNAYSTQALASGTTFYDFGGTLAKGSSLSGIANTSLSWERTGELNVGFDYDILAGRIMGSVDVYNRLSKDLLIARELPIETGWGSVTDNVGSVRNKGVELMLRTINISTPNFSWETSFNFTKNTNEIVELFDKKEDLVGNKWFIGENVNVNYTYVFDGIWQESEADLAEEYGQSPGQARVKDIDGNGLIDGDDRQIIGNPDPSWMGGISTTVRYKNFDVSATLFTKQDVQVYSGFHNEFTNLDDRGRAKLNVNYYMPENLVTPTRASNEYPQPKNMGPYWRGENGVGSYKDASFTKIQNILVGYTLPNTALDKMHLKSMRLYVNILNPFVFTDYDGFDPEYAGASFGNGGNSSVVYQFGTNIKF